MNNSNRRIPKHCHHKPTGQGYVRLGGRTFYTGKWKSDKGENKYRSLVAQWLSNRQLPGNDLGDFDYLVKDLIADFWIFAEGYYVKDGQPTGETPNIRYALRPLRELFGEIPVAGFGPSKLKIYRDELIS